MLRNFSAWAELKLFELPLIFISVELYVRDVYLAKDFKLDNFDELGA